MSDYHEITLRRYEEQLEQLHQEEYERAKNPKMYSQIITPNWEEYSDTEEETAQLIEQATAEGLKYSCIKHIYA